MRIKKVLISFVVQEKIFKEHNVKREEIEGLFFDRPYFFRTKKDRYIAIGFAERYITAVFDYKEINAIVVTAYQSSEWQKRLYKRKK